MFEIRLFGDREFWWNGQPLGATLRPRAVSLLAYLAFHRERPVTRASLALSLWPDDDDKAARANLRRHLNIIANLSPKLEQPLLSVSQTHLQWNAQAAARVDIIEFERLAAGESTYHEAIELYRGDLLTSLDDDWVYEAREKLRTSYIGMLVVLGERALRDGDFERATVLADRLAVADEWREEAIRIKMTALARMGQSAAALAAYDRFARVLREHMDVDPTVDTVSLRNAIASNAPLSAIDSNLDTQLHASDVAAFLPFAGRRDELTRLRAMWNKAARGHGTTVFVQGEAGIGKSRLAHELALLAQRQGGLTLVGTTSHPEDVVRQSVLQALRGALRYLADASIDSEWLSTLAEMLPELHALRPDLPPAEPIDPHYAERRTVEAIARALEAVARRKPVVLILEDLQWASDATIVTLATLARRCAALPLLIVVTVRTHDDAPPALNRTRHELLKEQRATLMTIGPIASGEFMNSRTDDSPLARLPRDVIVNAAELGGGNPLFVTLLLRTYLDTGALVAGAHGSHTIADAVAARINHLDDEGRSLAQTAAVVGSSFNTTLLARVTGWDERAVLDGLDVLIDAGIVRESAASYEYTFSHALIENAFYESLDPNARALRHRRVAVSLEGLGSDGRAATIARHWSLAGYPDAACIAYERASRDAAESFSWIPSRTHAVAGLGIANDDAQRVKLARLAARASRYIGDSTTWESDVVTFERAAENGSADDRMDALLERIAFVQHAGRTDEMLAVIEQLEAMATTANASEYQARADFARAIYYTVSASPAKSEQLLRSLLTAQREVLLTPDERIDARINLGNVLLRLGRLDEADAIALEARTLIVPTQAFSQLKLAMLESSLAFGKQRMGDMESAARRMLEIHQRNGDVPQEAQARAFLGLALAAWPERARREFDLACEIATATQKPMTLLMAVLNRGDIERRFGRLDLALTYAREAQRIASEIREPVAEAHALINEAFALSESGATEAGLTVARKAHDVASSLEESRVLSGSLIALGAASLRCGDVTHALEYLRAGIIERRKSQFVASLVEDLAMLAEALLAADQPAAAHDAIREMVSLVGGKLEDQRRPAYLCSVAVTVFRANRIQDGAGEWRKRGKSIMDLLYERIPDRETRDAFLNLPYNRHLLR